MWRALFIIKGKEKVNIIKIYIIILRKYTMLNKKILRIYIYIYIYHSNLLISISNVYYLEKNYLEKIDCSIYIDWIFFLFFMNIISI